MFDLQRFVDAQENTHAVALQEIKEAYKKTHWMWFIFPQISGLGDSARARKYAIVNIEEARAYMQHPVLGPRLIDFSEAIFALSPDVCPEKTVPALLTIPGLPPAYQQLPQYVQQHLKSVYPFRGAAFCALRFSDSPHRCCFHPHAMKFRPPAVRPGLFPGRSAASAGSGESPAVR